MTLANWQRRLGALIEEALEQGLSYQQVSGTLDIARIVVLDHEQELAHGRDAAGHSPGDQDPQLLEKAF
jgi:hypothetical protein